MPEGNGMAWVTQKTRSRTKTANASSGSRFNLSTLPESPTTFGLWLPIAHRRFYVALKFGFCARKVDYTFGLWLPIAHRRFYVAVSSLAYSVGLFLSRLLESSFDKNRAGQQRQYQPQLQYSNKFNLFASAAAPPPPRFSFLQLCR
ncbi:hypothetical protein B0H16DRAFT_1466859 [Mycena metata]|uniref:Uncharacterized protein n=1 Tax=Mycena metata TaxID=1033252 RepID=A0AAD7I6Y9_9AGAR|nr:hypothetical protein B0H16DRAFT_1466859 [Mycena metata]